MKFNLKKSIRPRIVEGDPEKLSIEKIRTLNQAMEFPKVQSATDPETGEEIPLSDDDKERINLALRMADSRRVQAVEDKSQNRQLNRSDGGNAKNADYQVLRPQYQPFINDLHQKNPHRSYAELQRRAAGKFNVSPSTIKNHTVNPKK